MMKGIRVILLFAISIVISSCEKEPELVSKWKLIETLADPGDGSGQFQPVESDKTMEFFADGTVVSNGILCQMSVESGNNSTGTYSELEMNITPDNCGINPFVVLYEIQESHLVLSYPCFEPCREKYEVTD